MQAFATAENATNWTWWLKLASVATAYDPLHTHTHTQTYSTYTHNKLYWSIKVKSLWKLAFHLKLISDNNACLRSTPLSRTADGQDGRTDGRSGLGANGRRCSRLTQWLTATPVSSAPSEPRQPHQPTNRPTDGQFIPELATLPAAAATAAGAHSWRDIHAGAESIQDRHVNLAV